MLNSALSGLNVINFSQGMDDPTCPMYMAALFLETWRGDLFAGGLSKKLVLRLTSSSRFAGDRRRGCNVLMQILESVRSDSIDRR